MKQAPLVTGIALLGCLVTNGADAQGSWLIGAEYQALSGDTDYFGTEIDFDLNVLGGFVGYRQPLSGRWSLNTQLSLGTSVGKDDDNQVVIFGDILADIDVDLSYFAGVQTQFEFAQTDRLLWFVGPSINRYAVKAEERNIASQTETDWKLGLSGGVGFQLTNDSQVKVAYTHLSDIQAISLAWESRF